MTTTTIEGYYRAIASQMSYDELQEVCSLAIARGSLFKGYKLNKPHDVLVLMVAYLLHTHTHTQSVSLN